MQKFEIWIRVSLAFLLTVLSVGTLLPFVRNHPESLDAFAGTIPVWLRTGVTFFACCAVAMLLFRTLSPHFNHLKHLKTHPPIWLAVLMGFVIIGVIDVSWGLEANGYRGSFLDWFFYGAGSTLVASGLIQIERQSLGMESVASPASANRCSDMQTQGIPDLINASCADLVGWLKNDAHADYDLLNNRRVAERLAKMIRNGTRSIGIVGPFGAGKTSLVYWIKEEIERETLPTPKDIVCIHSCWGFETADSAIYDMLNSAVSRLRLDVDTFPIESLPRLYSNTFSERGDWVGSIASLLLSDQSVYAQFKKLSSMLGGLNQRMIFVVEDLDRTNSKNFDKQEVLAFLERLKPYDNLAFVLTGGSLSSREIDFTKLCDHIEYMKTVSEGHAADLVGQYRKLCLDKKRFPHKTISTRDRDHEWNEHIGLITRRHEEFTLPQAVALLLNTPRSLRHALQQTYTAWQTLHGEVSFDDLFGLNVLRFGAPECLSFLGRRRDRLCDVPTHDPRLGNGNITSIRDSLIDDWRQTTHNVEWSSNAARTVLTSLLPATRYWLIDETYEGQFERDVQGIGHEKYWLRAINEHLTDNEIADQEVLRDIEVWSKSPSMEAELISKLTTSSNYGSVWEQLGRVVFTGKDDEILLLTEHVLQRILQEEGVKASKESQGFIRTWQVVTSIVPHGKKSQGWLLERLFEASEISWDMMDSIWRFYGGPGSYKIIRPGVAREVREELNQHLQLQFNSGLLLAQRLAPARPYVLFHLVFDQGGDDHIPTLDNVESWQWLGPVILEALREQNDVIASNCAVLLGGRVKARQKVAIDHELLNSFFGQQAKEVIDILDELVDRMPKDEQQIARNVVRAARESEQRKE